MKAAGTLSTLRERYSVQGVTNFPGFVKRKWPLFRDTGFPIPGKPKQEALLCIADADVVADQLGLTRRTKPYEEWIAPAEAEFTELLRQQTDQPHRVHGALLRWSLESTSIAGFDEREAMLRLAGSARLDEALLDEFLDRCRPDPRTIDDAAFVDTFDAPQPCLARLAQHLGWRKLKKGDPRKDESLAWITAHRLDKLLRRVPDIVRIATLVRTIAASIGTE